MDSIPTDRPLQQPEVYMVVAQTVLTMSEDDTQGRIIDAAQLVHPESCANSLKLTNKDMQAFARVNRESFPEIANPFINRLISANILGREWTSASSHFRLNPDKVDSLESIATLEGFTTLEFVETIEDADLRSRCGATVLQNVHADSLLREAVTVLEDRLRKMLTTTDRVDRGNLAALVLHPDRSTNPVGTNRDRQLNFFSMVQGLLGFYGSEVHHGLIEVNPRTARTVISMIDEILAMLK